MPGMDKNGQIAALLRDLAAVQKSTQSMWGYKRAANAILELEDPIESLLRPDGTLAEDSERRTVVNARSSSRCCTPAGRRPSSAAIAESGKRRDVERRARLARRTSLSRAQVLAALRDEVDRAARRRLSRRSADALDLERRRPNARGDRRGRHRRAATSSAASPITRTAFRSPAACRWRSSAKQHARNRSR